MTFPAGQEELANVCPYLGLADDADSHATYPTEAHRCYRLENPTRIATGHQETYCLGANHVTCPVFRGEGIGATRAAAGAGAAAAAGGRPGRGPRPAGEGAPRGRAGREGGRSPALERRRPTGTLSPRPSGGGISMPVATIGLFALAIVVLALAFIINRAVGGNGGDDLSPADQFASQQANRSETQTPAGSGGSDQTPDQGNDQQPGGGATTPAGGDEGGDDEGDDETPTPSGGGSSSGDVYVVQAGDMCATIAQEHGLTLDELYELNPEINDGCTNLSVGQELRVR